MHKSGIKKIVLLSFLCLVICLIAGRIFYVNAHAVVKTEEQVGLGELISFGGGYTYSGKYLPLGALTAKVNSCGIMSLDEVNKNFPDAGDLTVSVMPGDVSKLFFVAAVDIANTSDDPQPFDARDTRFGTAVWMNALNGPWFSDLNKGYKLLTDIPAHTTKTFTMVAPIPNNYYPKDDQESVIKNESFEIVFSQFPHRASVSLNPNRNVA